MEPAEPEHEDNDEISGMGLPSDGHATEETVQWSSTSEESTTRRTIDEIESTIEMDSMELAADLSDPLPGAEAVNPVSVMHSANISQTINPRELSKEDAAFWGSAAIGASDHNRDEPSRLAPAAERSIRESKLQIRQRDLAAPTRDADAPSDYRLIRLLGRGGMGNVYVARQASLDRMIAVKVIKPLPKEKRQQLRESGRLDAVEHERRQQFLSEAVVTGDLDHPNIVPIHDIAVASDNTLFYAMKRVVGKPWLKTIDDLSRDENLEILLKVCDAIAFAHTRGVIHRDIKPENIMLGDFGEVLVMDWGLAIAKPEFEKKESITSMVGLGGTPAYMAPEMAIGPIESIGPHSDIYLLGATLFYIVTGYTAHKGDNVSQCIRAVATNQIQPVATERQGELLDIALQAMATDPKARFESVQAFQQAIRRYRSHSESIAISATAERHYQDAMRTSRYESFSRASHGFEQAVALWGGNQPAMEGLAQCRLDHARAAYSNGDYDLGLSLLDAGNPQHVPQIEELNAGIRLRLQKASRLKLFRRLVAASLLFILVGGGTALYVINQKRAEADEQRTAADTQRKAAETQTGIANEQRQRAEQNGRLAENRLVQVEQEKAEVQRQKSIAEQNEIAAKLARVEAEQNEQRALDQEALAVKNATEAERQKTKAIASEQAAIASLQRAEYETYLSQIGLAKARIDGNEFDDARRILASIRDLSIDFKPAWEWRFLWQQSNQAISTVPIDVAVRDLAIGQSSRSMVVVLADGQVQRSHLDAATEIVWRFDLATASCVALDEANGSVAIGTEQGGVLLLELQTGRLIRRIRGHESSVTDLEFLADGNLLTSSTDHTVALWDIPTGRRLSRCWHIGPVVDFALQANPSQQSAIVIAAIGDSSSGRVAGWRLSDGQFDPLGIYTAHLDPVVSVAVSADGTLAASGDARGKVHLWHPDQLVPTDYKNALEQSVAAINTNTDAEAQWVASRKSASRTLSSWSAHPDAIAVMEFDRETGNLLTGSDDYTIRGWDVGDQSMQFSLRGHGGWVRALQSVPSESSIDGRFLYSGSVDGTIRIWKRPSNPTLVTSRPAAGQAENQEDENFDGQVHEDEILAARLDRSGEKIITASRDHRARILQIDRQSVGFREIARLRTDERNGSDLSEGTEFLAMSAQIDVPGNRLFIGSADSIIRIWDIETGTQLGSLSGTGLNNGFVLSQDGTRLLSGSSRSDAKALLWDVDPDHDRVVVLHAFADHDQAVTAFAISADGRMVATGDRGGRCVIWNGETGARIALPIDLFRGYRINDLALTRNGKSLWVACDNGQLAEFDLDSREPLRRLEHQGFVTAISVIPGEDQIASLASETRDQRLITTARLWNLETETDQILDQVVADLELSGQSSGDHAQIHSVRFGQNGDKIVICSQEKGGRTGRVTVIDRTDDSSRAFDLPTQIGVAQTGLLLATGKLITLNGEAAFRWSLDLMLHEKSYRPHGTVVDASFSPDGQLAATVSRSVRLWETATGKAIDKLESPHQGQISDLDFSSQTDDQGYLFATCGNEAQARLWHWKDQRSGFQLTQEFEIAGTEIEHLRFSPDGQSLLLAGKNGIIEIRSVRDRSLLYRWELPNQATSTCLSFSIDGRYVAIGVTDKSVWLIDLQVGSAVKPRVMRGHADRIESVCVLHDESNRMRVLTASRDKSVRVWDPRLEIVSDDLSGDSEVISGREILSLHRHNQGVTAVECTPDGNLVMTAARDGQVLLWPADSAIETPGLNR